MNKYFGILVLLCASLSGFGAAAASYNRFAVIDELSAVGRPINTAGYEQKMLRGQLTALMVAADMGDAAAVEALLNRNANVHETDISGKTALMYAAMNGNAEVVQRLLDAGSDVNRVTRIFHENALLLASESEGVPLSVFKILVRSGSQNRMSIFGQTALSKAARKGNLALVHYLITSKYSDVKADATQALYGAVLADRPDIVELLVRAGVDLSKDGNGEEELVFAEKHGKMRAYEKLHRLMYPDYDASPSTLGLLARGAFACWFLWYAYPKIRELVRD